MFSNLQHLKLEKRFSVMLACLIKNHVCTNVVNLIPLCLFKFIHLFPTDWLIVVVDSSIQISMDRV